jgi:hypothetical protein
MHDVVAVALVSGLSGVSGSAVTYLATKRQADRQSDTERARIKAEAERMHVQYDEEHARHRQTTYHELLTNVSAWHRSFVAYHVAAEPEWVVWLQRLEEHFNGVSLFCSEGVLVTLGPLKAVIEQGKISGVTSSFAGEYQAAYEVTVEAMRKDTAPGF